MQLSEQAKAAQRAYKKKWRNANKEKVQAANCRYWEKKAAQAKEKKADE